MKPQNRPKRKIVELYKGKNGYRWRISDFHNKKITQASTQGYSRRIDCLKNLDEARYCALHALRHLCHGRGSMKVEVFPPSKAQRLV